MLPGDPYHWGGGRNTEHETIYIYIYTHGYTYIHIHIYIYIHTHIHLYIHINTCIYTFIHIYTYIHITHIFCTVTHIYMDKIGCFLMVKHGVHLWCSMLFSWVLSYPIVWWLQTLGFHTVSSYLTIGTPRRLLGWQFRFCSCIFFCLTLTISSFFCWDHCI